ncbi:hypothetical protein HDG42_007291 [Paraburkholderia sp. JPY171]|nr:hypothetical protein [Paraburkholderia atlantica]
MMRDTRGNDPWLGIVRNLLLPKSVTAATTLLSATRAEHRIRVDFRAPGGVCGARIDDGTRAARIVNVLDRLSDHTVAISWRDATMCHYNDQIWRLGVARRQGECALTGESVGVGEAIYRPIPITPPPLNAQAMILASALAGAVSHGDDLIHQRPKRRSCRPRI